jgi:polyphosphate glucokinase
LLEGCVVKILAIDVGGTHVKVLLSGQKVPRKAVSGPTMSARRMVAMVMKLADGWKWDVVSIGYPGPVLHGRPAAEPHNLAAGWVGFDFEKGFQCPVKIVNDAAMQALGSYTKGKMLFLGLGTGLGSALIVDGAVAALELAHLPYKKATYEDYVGLRSLEKRGKKKWRHQVAKVVSSLAAAFEPDEVVLGGGNAHLLMALPRGCRLGENANAFVGGFRLWEKRAARKVARRAKPSRPATPGLLGA